MNHDDGNNWIKQQSWRTTTRSFAPPPPPSSFNSLQPSTNTTSRTIVAPTLTTICKSITLWYKQWLRVYNTPVRWVKLFNLIAIIQYINKINLIAFTLTLSIKLTVHNDSMECNRLCYTQMHPFKWIRSRQNVDIFGTKF